MWRHRKTDGYLGNRKVVFFSSLGNHWRERGKKEPLPISSFMMGLSGSLFFSYISGYIRGSGLAMIQLECLASPFPAPDVVLSSSAQASRAFSGVRMFVFIFYG